MIELKLRAWNRHTKTIQPVKYLRWLANGNIASIGCGDETGFQERLRPRDCVLIRYAGIKDMHGKEIYEGDICTALAAVTLDLTHPDPLSTATRETFTGVVTFDPYRGWLIGTNSITLLDNVEIVGNICDNRL